MSVVRLARTIELRIRHFDPYRDKPPICRVRYRRAERLARKAQRLGHGNLADLWQPDRLAVQSELVVHYMEAVSTAAFF